MADHRQGNAHGGGHEGGEKLNAGNDEQYSAGGTVSMR